MTLNQAKMWWIGSVETRFHGLCESHTVTAERDSERGLVKPPIRSDRQQDEFPLWPNPRGDIQTPRMDYANIGERKLFHINLQTATVSAPEDMPNMLLGTVYKALT